MWMYVGTYTRTTSRGIYGLKLDETTGRFAEPKLMAETPNPSFMAMTDDRKRLYAACDPGKVDGKSHGGVAGFTIDPATHGLTPINTRPSGEGGNCYVGVSKGGTFVACADYGAAVVTLLPLRPDGGIDPSVADVKHTGHGPNTDRQDKAHAHCATFDPTGEFLLACDLGTDEIYVYRVSATPPGLTQHSVFKVAPGSGPRHVTFNRDGRLVYLVNELGNQVDVLKWAAGTLTQVQRVPMLPADFTAYSKAAEVAVHPSGAFVYASNRGHDSIATYHVDRDSGELSPAGQTPCGGSGPRHFAIDPSGKFAVVANELSNNVVAFRIDAETGELKPTGGVATVTAPVCVLF